MTKLAKRIRWGSLLISGGGEGKGRKLGTVTRLEYLGAIVIDNGSKTGGSLSRIAQDTSALTKLKLIWRVYNIVLGLKVKHM